MGYLKTQLLVVLQSGVVWRSELTQVVMMPLTRKPVPVKTSCVDLVNKAAFPVSAELEYLYASGLSPDVKCLVGLPSLAVDAKASHNNDLLRKKITIKGRSRKLHARETCELSYVLDLVLGTEYNTLLEIQAGISPYRTEPEPSWLKLSANVFQCQSTGTIYYRRNKTGEFCIRIPKIKVIVERRDEDTIQNMVFPKREGAQVAPTLDNPAFLELYEAALKNLEAEPVDQTPKQDPLPLSTFVEEDRIQRAIRRAKEKYRNKTKGAGVKTSQKRMAEEISSTPVKMRKMPEPPTPVVTRNFCLLEDADREPCVSTPKRAHHRHPQATCLGETPMQRALRLAKEKPNFLTRRTKKRAAKKIPRVPAKMATISERAFVTSGPCLSEEDEYIEPTPQKIQRLELPLIPRANLQLSEEEKEPVVLASKDDLPLTFVEETPIQRALRLAKGKYRNKSESDRRESKDKGTSGIPSLSTPVVEATKLPESPSLTKSLSLSEEDENDDDIIVMSIDDEPGDWLI